MRREQNPLTRDIGSFAAQQDSQAARDWHDHAVPI
jgi:hypothetical protein